MLLTYPCHIPHPSHIFPTPVPNLPLLSVPHSSGFTPASHMFHTFPILVSHLSQTSSTPVLQLSHTCTSLHHFFPPNTPHISHLVSFPHVFFHLSLTCPTYVHLLSFTYPTPDSHFSLIHPTCSSHVPHIFHLFLTCLWLCLAIQWSPTVFKNVSFIYLNEIGQVFERDLFINIFQIRSGSKSKLCFRGVWLSAVVQHLWLVSFRGESHKDVHAWQTNHDVHPVRCVELWRCPNWTSSWET